MDRIFHSLARLLPYLLARLHWGDCTGRGGWRGGKVPARRVADRDARTAQPARSARGAACTILARALTLPHGPWTPERSAGLHDQHGPRGGPGLDTVRLHRARCTQQHRMRTLLGRTGAVPRAPAQQPEARTPQSDDAPDVRAHCAPNLPARSRRDSTFSPRGEVGTGCALPSRSRSPR